MDCVKINLSANGKKNILALGAQSKGSFCFIKGDAGRVCESFADLGELENFRRFQRHLEMIEDRFRIRPEIIACDLHPEYITSKYARELAEDRRERVVGIQHHEAHIASCMADNDVKGRVIGVAFDGTGFGLDGNIWGGEFFTGSMKGFRRAGHLKYIPMPGGEAAVREPWRMAVSYLYDTYGPKFTRLGIDFTNRLDRGSAGFVRQIIDKKVNSPLTSSMGRLFDAVAAIIGIRNKAEYEGQAAIELEQKLKTEHCRPKAENNYNFKYKYKSDIIMIDWMPVLKGVVKDLRNKKTGAEISLEFHNAVCYMIRDVCNLLRERHKINKVCMSGGVFQNKYLTSKTRPLLEEQGFMVYSHKRVPAHDGNIALGQAAMVKGM